MRPKLEDLRIKMLEKCFDCFCQNGLENTSTRKLAEACGMTDGNIFHYFASKDEIIIKSTAHCMAKVEDDFMKQAPKDLADIDRFLEEVPYWTAEKHGKQYRFMYQVYASPRYRDYGKAFFQGVDLRYRKYAEQLSPKLGLSADLIQGMTYLFVRACVHYALFEGEDYLQLQLNAIRASLRGIFAESTKEE